MRKPDPAAAASKASLAVGRRDAASTELICLALALAVVALAMRIASVW